MIGNKLSLLLLFLVFSSTLLLSQNKVTGTITSADEDETLIGVTVQLKGTSTGTATDISGNYEVSANLGDTLIFSYTGYETLQAIINSNSLNVKLNVASQLLNEIVVIGYGTTTIKDATGSVVSLSERDFNKGNIVTPENLLNGKVAGLTITTGGAPGSGSTIRIRGGSSLGASNDPLIVINGLPISNNTIGGSRSILSTINPNDIASFTVLKDASATA
ncbi:MAG: hypothetical protein ACI8VT_002373, partial [Saprospiraceae bacterium]